MKALTKYIRASIFILGLTFFLNGCAFTNPNESQMPWGKPADWEQKGPGMPGGIGGR